MADQPVELENGEVGRIGQGIAGNLKGRCLQFGHLNAHFHAKADGKARGQGKDEVIVAQAELAQFRGGKEDNCGNSWR